jgi:hypothetical protein
MSVCAVHAKVICFPQGEEAIEWMLLKNIPLEKYKNSSGDSGLVSMLLED